MASGLDLVWANFLEEARAIDADETLTPAQKRKRMKAALAVSDEERLDRHFRAQAKTLVDIATNEEFTIKARKSLMRTILKESKTKHASR